MKCHCEKELEVKKEHKVVKYICNNVNCYFVNSSLFRDNIIIYYNENTHYVNVYSNEKDIYGFSNNISIVHISDKDILVSKEEFFKLLEKESLKEIKQLYDNYSLFI